MRLSASPCWSCGVRHNSDVSCPLCGAPFDYAARIRLETIAKFEADARSFLGRVARLANSSLKHGERELSTAANVTESKVAELLRSIEELRKAVRRDAERRVAEKPALKAVP